MPHPIRKRRAFAVLYYISMDPAHPILAKSCIGTLLKLDHRVEVLDPSLPLVPYAARNWFHHAKWEAWYLTYKTGWSRNHFETWVATSQLDSRRSERPLGVPSIRWEDLLKPEYSPPYFSALCGIGYRVEYHLVITQRHDPTESHGFRGTPLHVAVEQGHTAIVQFSLEHSADVNSRRHYELTPLCFDE